jgi:DNA-binding transcriptional ArsR family regulator
MVIAPRRYGVDKPRYMNYHLYKTPLIYEVINMAIADEQARLLQCIGEPTRLQILKLLAEGEKYVGEITEALGKEQSLVSYHLRALRECNIVVVNQEAQRVYYKLSDAKLAELVNISEAVVKDIFLCRPKENPNRKADKLK